MRFLVALLLLSSVASAQVVPPFRVSSNGTLAAKQYQINLVDTLVTCANNAGQHRTDCTWLGYGQAFAAASSTPSGYWRLQSGAASGGSWTSLGDFMRVYPGTTGATPWNMGVVAYANDGNPNYNNVVTSGWNCGSSGSIDTAKGALCTTTESEYGPTGGALMEHYVGYVAPGGGTSYRALTLNAALASPYELAVGLVGTTVGIGVGTSINDATRLVLGASSSTLNAPSAAGDLTLNATTSQLTFGSAGNLARLALLSGSLTLKATAGALGSSASGDVLTWDATNSRLRDGTGSYYYNATNGSVTAVANTTTALSSTGVTTYINGATDVYVYKGGARAFRFGETGNEWKIFGATDGTGAGAYVGIAPGAFVGLQDNGERIQAADGAGVLFRTNGVGRARFDYSSFRPDTDGTFNLGSGANRWSLAYIGSSSALGTCDATERGAMRTQFAAGGASDTLQVCMKAAADTYAWRTVFTAP
jgi:hypothetical protein